MDDEVKWLIAREIPRMRRYAYALVHDPDAADDLTQDCLERALRKRHMWGRQGSVRNWMFRILYTVFLNQASSRSKRRRQVELSEDDPRHGESPSQVHEVACKDILAAMQLLPADQRAAIELTAVEGLSYDEAAEVLGIPIGTLRSRLSRGRDQMRRLYVPQAKTAMLRRVK